MVQLVEQDIETREVLSWKGLHVLHGTMSTCSKKLRIFLNLKGVPWRSHVIDLPNNENMTPWFLGINPRGLVPVLVHDGAVHIESNDIIAYLEELLPQPRLIPPGHENEVAKLLRHEDDLHVDVRTLSFRFVFVSDRPRKTSEDLRKYASSSGTVGGRKDVEINKQIGFWSGYVAHGITEDQVRASAGNFRKSFCALEEGLDRAPYLLGNELSVLDIAWFIYVDRLTLAGYPFERLHPRVFAWFAKLRDRPEFAKEIELSAPMRERFAATRQAQAQAGKSLETVAGF